jgi:hypothetical protein
MNTIIKLRDLYRDLSTIWATTRLSRKALVPSIQPVCFLVIFDLLIGRSLTDFPNKILWFLIIFKRACPANRNFDFATVVTKTIVSRRQHGNCHYLSYNWWYPTENEASNKISIITATRPCNGEFCYRVRTERERVAGGGWLGENQFAAAPYRRQPVRCCYSLHFK